jgi:signal transduction histidine kinase
MEIAERDARVMALSQLASRMVHDFNNYLTPIKGYLGLFKEECAPESATLRYAGLMEKAACKIEYNIDAIAAAVRPERNYRPSPTDLRNVIEQSIKEWNDQLNTPLSISTTLCPCPVTIDINQWRGVLFHLLENARFACAEGGSVEIKLTKVTLTAGDMAMLGMHKAGSCRLEITDKGCGMPPEILNRALEPFFTTRSKDKAAGLGLTQAFNVTRLHGGQIMLESQTGTGTTVTIWLPL